MNKPAARQADWRQGWILVFAGFLPVMAIVALAPTLPTLLAHFHDVGNPEIMVPLLITAPSACIALFAPLAGVLTDRFGRRNLLLGAFAVYALGGLIPFLVDSFWVVVASRVVIGIGEAAVLTVTNTLMADYFEGRARARWLMIQGLTGAFMGSAVIFCSGFLAAQGWQYPFLVYVLALPILVTGWLYLYEPLAHARPGDAGAGTGTAALRAGFPWSTAGLTCGITALLGIIYFVQVINFSVLLSEMGVHDPKSIGMAMSIPSMGVPVGSVLFILTTRFGPSAQILLVLACYCVGLSGIGLAPGFEIALVFAFFQQVANGIIVPALINWVQSQYAFQHRGRGMGLWTSAFFVSQFLSPVAVKLVQARVGGLQAAFLVFGVLSGVIVLLFLLVRGKSAPQADAATGTR
ncbi:MFS transporter [Telluria mixta]|uniref:MFS transporter n=1 Tax=Telluria mixta TaxID=34071 RepID=A0ABT2BYT9_9BURK|nr:MFS transporter [Telluria mixta]MCS0630216.1 MFS transporter [Telluria mixta]WEM94476.1 MFS transporter [Telluria mixta]